VSGGRLRHAKMWRRGWRSGRRERRGGGWRSLRRLSFTVKAR